MSDQHSKRYQRCQTLFSFDTQFVKTACQQTQAPLIMVMGVDEVGRGSLVGPVVAAALIFPNSVSQAIPDWLHELDDSKASHLTHDKRVRIADELKKQCYWALGEASQQEIETINISQASLLAGQRAVFELFQQFPQCQHQQTIVIMDGRSPMPGLPCYQQAVVKADSQSACVAGASIIAKAHRDTMLREWGATYPEYQWDKNSGYPTPGHKAALKQWGATPLHRKTYKAVQEVLVSV